MSNWINESVFYHIYPLGMCGAPEYNNGEQSYSMDKIKEWIPHLKELGVNALYIGPLFESSKHGYDTKDYYKIDCRLGDNNSFKEICNQLHENGIKVILDGVFNHVGREFWAFKDVQKNGQNSPYCGWFQNLNFGGGSPMGDPFWYEGWSGHYDLVKLNLKNPEVVEHLLTAVGMWIDEFGIDGLRLDAADCIDLDFFRQLKNYCKNKKNDFWLMGEIIHGDYNRWANSETLDSVTNYECYKGIYSSHNDHNYFEIAHSLQRQFANGGIYSHLCLYNFVDNHDVNRVADNCRDNRHLKNVYTLLYTMPGVPSVYYGSEWGIKGSRTNNSDTALRPKLDLGNIPNANDELCSHLKKLGKIRHALSALKYGNFENKNIKNEQLVYERSFENQHIYIALNINENEQNVDFNVEGGFSKLTDALTGEVFYVNNYASIPVKSNSSRILILNNGDYTIDSFKDAESSTKQNNNTDVVEPLNEVTPGKYRHFKGGEYEVIGIAEHTETNEKTVVYKDQAENRLWARPYNMFVETVEHNGKIVRRFEKLD